MTLEEAIKRLEFDRAMILFNATTGKEITPEILKLINEDNYRTYVADGVAIETLKEIQQYREIGTVEECREAMANKKKCEKQWHNDMENPLEPIKVYSALKSEILKLELRTKNRPKDISILDYTVIAALQKVLKNNLEAMEDE